MEAGFSILFLLMIVVWVAVKEFTSHFRDIHIQDVMSVKFFVGFLFVVFVLCSCLAFQRWGSWAPFNGYCLLILTATLVIVLALTTATGIETSAVTALWGALAALAYHHHINGDFIQFTAIASLIFAPILVMALSFVFQLLFNRFIHQRDCHLLVKTLYLKRAMLCGVVIGSIALSWNYALLITPLLSSIVGQHTVSVPLHAALLIFFFAIVAAPAVQFGIQFKHSHKNQSQLFLPHLYSATLVMIVGNVVFPLISPAFQPIVVSANQLNFSSRLAMERERMLQHIIKWLSITLITPLLAFITGLALIATGDDSLLVVVITAFVLLSCLLAHLYFNQYNKHRVTKKALNDELIRQSEVGDELNRMDVAAVTSQFNVMTKEIDIKYKELINLSLHIKQQRQYLEELSLRIKKLSGERDVELLRNKMNDMARELGENLKLSAEMDHFYAQVDEMHKNFVSRLLMRCPTLTEREKRLAILIRLGYSSKDIASLMNVEPKTIEISRYRFRRKLKLDRSVNIVQYLQLL